MRIQQIQPWIDEDDADAVREAVASTFVSENERTRRFESLLSGRTGAAHTVAYCNASCALYAALRAVGIGPGDEVIVPDLTFVATSNAVLLAGATPVFADVDPVSMMMTAETAAARITPRTRAIMPVHLYGLAAEMPGLMALARRHGLRVIEDAAQGLGVRLGGKHVGTFGDAGIISFYGNKTLTTGEGGAILTDDRSLADAVYRLKNHGRMRKGIFIHEEIGFNFAFTEMQAALGISQLRKFDRVLQAKRGLHAHYAARLKDVEGVCVETAPPGVEPGYWFTNVRCGDATELHDRLAARGIQTRRLLHPLHLQPCYRHLPRHDCPVSRSLYDRVLSLPSWVGLSAGQLDEICDAIALQPVGA